MSVPSQEISDQNETSIPDGEESPQNEQEDMDTVEAFSDQGNTNRDANGSREDILSRGFDGEEPPQKEQEDADTGKTFYDQRNVKKDTNITGEDVLGQEFTGEEFPHKEMEDMDTSEAFDDQRKLKKGTRSIPEEDALTQVFEDEEDPVVENEPDDDGEEKSDDEDEEEDADSAGPFHSQVRSRTTKDTIVEQFEGYEFGEMRGSTKQKMTNVEDFESLQEASEKWTPANSSATAILNKTTARRFVCIDYPGVVKNKEKAVATLGGQAQIAQARKKEAKIELNFRPDEPFCKPTIGSFRKTNNLLIKCKRRKAPSDSPSSSQGDGFEYKIEVLGVVDSFFNFDVPADYQFLPVVKNQDGSKRNLLSDIVLKFEDEREDYMSRDVPLFVPPFSFARHEKPAQYNFQPDAVDEEDDDCAQSTVRKSRVIGTQIISFKAEGVPMEPRQDSLANLEKYKGEKIEEYVEPLKKLFEKRPLWTRSGMMANLPSHTYVLLKHVLPTIAYYHSGGPWRHAWCKLGYDPRKHPEAKQYQVIEFRIRANVKMAKIKSSTFGFHRKARAAPKEDPIVGDKMESSKPDDTAAGTSTGETASSEMDIKYQFLPSKLPPQRHMFYQVCDIHEDQIQQLAHQNDGQEKQCTERDGWCVPDFTSKSRDILTSCTDKLIS